MSQRKTNLVALKYPWEFKFFTKAARKRIKHAGKMQSILFRYLCSKMVGEQFTSEQRKFMVLSYHQTGSQVFKTPPANVEKIRG